MSVDRNKAVVRDFIELWTNEDGRWESADWSAYHAVLAPDFVIHAGRNETRGLEAFKAAFVPFYQALPDYEATVTFVFGEDDRVGARYEGRATHRSDALGVPATGDEIRYEGTILCRLEDGFIAEVWSDYDTLDFMKQIGAIPSA